MEETFWYTYFKPYLCDMNSSNRTLVFGDSHGAYRGVMQALERANYDPANDKLICLGDIQDGWSEAHKIITFLQGIENKIVIMGNHDECFVQWGAWGFPRFRHPLLAHGGKVTESEYFQLGPDVMEEHMQFHLKSDLYHLDDQNRLFVHAGWEPDYPHTEQKQDMLLWDRDFWDGMYKGRNLAKDYTEVYLGHTPTTSYQGNGALPMNRRNVWNLDTGAAFSGKITLMDVDTKEYWQSDTCTSLYPMESGRNHS